jgi:thiol-disulfide isomerase/thioredoxin
LGRRATIEAGIACAVLAACSGHAAGTGAPPGVSTVAQRPVVEFDLDSLDDRPVTGSATRGKPTLIAFVTTGSIAAQAQVDYLVKMAANDGDRVNYLLVALEVRENRELVELYRKSLGVTFPVAVLDPEKPAGAAAFGDVSVVPVTILLDRAGRVAWRVDGRVAKSAELRDAMRGL